jgi:ABC-2 type transport system permease protein
MTATETTHQESIHPQFETVPSTPLLLRSVGLKTFWDERHSILWWTGGSAVLSAVIIMLYPSIAVPELEELLERMPPAIQALMGEEIDLATVAGYLDLRMFTFLAPIVFLIYAIGRGTAAIAGEEHRGTMDLLLALPVQRWRIAVEKSMTMLTGLGIIGLGLWAGLVVGGIIVDVQFDISRAFQATVMGILLGMFHGGLALLIGGATGRTGLAIGVSAAAGVFGYLLQTLAPLVDWLQPFQILSPFYYYIDDSAMRNGMNLGHAMVLVVLAAILILAAATAFERRDVQV